MQDGFRRELYSSIAENSDWHLLDEREVNETQLAGNCADLGSTVPKLFLEVCGLLELEDLLLERDSLLPLQLAIIFAAVSAVPSLTCRTKQIEILARLECKEAVEHLFKANVTFSNDFFALSHLELIAEVTVIALCAVRVIGLFFICTAAHERRHHVKTIDIESISDGFCSFHNLVVHVYAWISCQIIVLDFFHIKGWK